MAEASTPRSPKRKKPLFVDVASDFETALFASVLPDITSGQAGFVAVGIDMAAQEGNWGVSVVTMDKEWSRGSLRLTYCRSSWQMSQTAGGSLSAC